MSDLLLTVSFTKITCCHEGCGIVFAVPDRWASHRRDDHSFWFCPNGHSQHFARGGSEKEKLEKQLAAKQAQLDQELAANQYLKMCRERADRRAAAARGQVTRIRKRVGNGVCPCCNRTFQNLMRHMQTQHPSFKHDPLVPELRKITMGD